MRREHDFNAGHGSHDDPHRSGEAHAPPHAPHDVPETALSPEAHTEVEPKLIAGATEGCCGGQCHVRYDEFFESIYRCADGDPTRVPWGDARPNPLLVQWLNREAWSVVRCGCRAVVVGCGLGDDVSELARRGYDALGFDVSPTAVRWAARRNPSCADRFITADVLALPPRLWGRFDLVIEINTIQSVEPKLRGLVAAGITRLLSPHGAVLAIARAREPAEPLDAGDGPPWPLTQDELAGIFVNNGLSIHAPVVTVLDDELPPKPRVMGVFTRPS